MSDSSKGPFVRCGACDAPLQDYTVLPLKAAEGDEHDYNGCYEDVCLSCKAATQRAYDYTFEQFDGLFDLTQAYGVAYGEIL